MRLLAGTSERIMQTQLDVTRAALARHLSEGGARRIRVRAAPVGVVQPVESLGSEVDPLALGDTKGLEQRYVPALESGVANHRKGVLRLVREGACNWLREYRASVRILDGEPEVVISTALRESAVCTRQEGVVGVAVHLPQLSVAGADARVVLGGADRDGDTRLKLGDGRDLPLAQQLPGQLGRLLEKWQFIDHVNHRDMPTVETGWSPEAPVIVGVVRSSTPGGGIVKALGIRVGESVT